MENFDELEKAMNVKTEIVKETKSVKVKPVKNGEDDPKKDYEYSRAQLYNLVEKGQEAINGILDVCQDSQHPRAYEVAGQLIKSVADTTDKLLDLQKKMVDLEQPTGTGPKTVNNSVFIGSTADLQKIIKQGNINKK
jgi:hypothetical protein